MSHGINIPRDQCFVGSMPRVSMPREINAPWMKVTGTKVPFTVWIIVLNVCWLLYNSVHWSCNVSSGVGVSGGNVCVHQPHRPTGGPREMARQSVWVSPAQTSPDHLWNQLSLHGGQCIRCYKQLTPVSKANYNKQLTPVSKPNYNRVFERICRYILKNYQGKVV